MMVLSIILSIYLSIGILTMLLSYYIAHSRGVGIDSKTMITGVLVWALVFPEFVKLLWSTIKLTYHEQKLKWMFRRLQQQRKKLRSELDSALKEGLDEGTKEMIKSLLR